MFYTRIRMSYFANMAKRIQRGSNGMQKLENYAIADKIKSRNHEGLQGLGYTFIWQRICSLRYELPSTCFQLALKSEKLPNNEIRAHNLFR